jgi:hypothetical protein
VIQRFLELENRGNYTELNWIIRENKGVSLKSKNLVFLFTGKLCYITLHYILEYVSVTIIDGILSCCQFFLYFLFALLNLHLHYTSSMTSYLPLFGFKKLYSNKLLNTNSMYESNLFFNLQRSRESNPKPYVYYQNLSPLN